MRVPTSIAKPTFGFLLFGGAVGLSLLVVFLQGRYLATSRENAVQRAQANSRNLAQAVDHNLSFMIRRIDHTLVSVTSELERHHASGKLDLKGMREFLAREERLLPEVVSLRVADEKGVVFLNNPSGNPLASLEHRPYFAFLRDHPEGGLYVAKPVVGVFTNAWLIGFARRYNLPDGRFGGVVVAPVRLELFQKVLAGYEVGPGGLLSLRDSEGGFIARFPLAVKGQTLAIGDKNISEDLRAIINSGVSRATYSTRTPFDQTQRTFTFRRLEAAPLLVLAGLAEEDYLAQWYKDRQKNQGMTTLFLVGAWVMAGLLWHLWKSREREAAALRESEERYRTQFKLASEGIVLLSTQGKVLEVNEVFARMHGYAMEEFPANATIRDINSPADNELMPERLRRLLVGETLTFEVEHLHRNGHVFPVEVSASLISFGGKQGILAYNREVSERKAHEREIVRMHRLYDMLIELGPSLIRTKSPEELFREICALAVGKAGFRLAWVGWVDPATRQVLQVAKAGAAVGYLDGLSVWADERPEGKGPTGTCIRENRSYVCQDFLTDPATIPWREKAETFGLHASAAVPILSQGQVAGALMVYSGEAGIFQDKEVALLEQAAAHISFGLDRLASEQLSRQLQDEIARSQKMQSLGSLAGGVAHDMNNVLGAIMGLASVHYLKAAEGTPLKREMEIIVKACERGGAMVKRLLSFARKELAEERELNLNDLVREQAALLEHTTLHTIRLETLLAADLHPIKGDHAALSVALMNLCINASDAMSERGTLTLGTRNLDNGWVELTVKDTGTGMSKEVLEKALDPFFTTKAQGKGTGLGLSMVYTTVKAHRGELGLQSEPGVGTVVTLRFPACVNESQGVATALENGRGSVRGALSVLLVDDDELIQSSVQSLLELLGHQATLASTGEEALRKLEAGLQPDVVILDMNMPGLGGAGTLPRLRALRPRVPVLLATGRVDQAAQDLTDLHPPTTLLPKPFGLKELELELSKIPRH